VPLLLLIRKLVGALLSGSSSSLQLKNAQCGENFVRKCCGYNDKLIITVASEMTSNISKLNNSNFHPRVQYLYESSKKAFESHCHLFPACAPKAIVTSPALKDHSNFTIIWIFMLCFFLFLFYIEPTIFCVRCANGKWPRVGSLHAS